MTDADQIKEAAARLDQATQAARPIAQLSLAGLGFTLAQAYRVQHAGMALRQARGGRPVGVKLGFTSRAKALQMGVDDVIMGSLTGDMQIADGGALDLDALIHPRVEPEIAFRLGRRLEPVGPTERLTDAVDAVAPALEIIDSRYRDFQFSLEDVVADNTSAARFTVGSWQSASEPDMQRRVRESLIELQVDGVVREAGAATAILGDPWHAVESVLRMATEYGFDLHAGTILLVGAATPAIPVEPGTSVRVEASGLGAAQFSTIGRAGTVSHG